jgi:hypothetical protein
MVASKFHPKSRRPFTRGGNIVGMEPERLALGKTDKPYCPAGETTLNGMRPTAAAAEGAAACRAAERFQSILPANLEHLGLKILTVSCNL